MACECLRRVDEQLQKRNCKVATAFEITPDMEMLLVILVGSEKIDKGKRGRPPQIQATYCPFCGKKWFGDSSAEGAESAEGAACSNA